MRVCLFAHQRNGVYTLSLLGFPNSSSVHGNHNSEIAINKGKLGNRESSTHASIPSHPSSRGSVQPLAHDTKDWFNAAPVANFVPGSASACGYPVHAQIPFGVSSHLGVYVCYHPHPFNHLGTPRMVLGILCSLEGNSMSAPNLHGCQHQS